MCQAKVVVWCRACAKRGWFRGWFEMVPEFAIYLEWWFGVGPVQKEAWFRTWFLLVPDASELFI